MKLTFNGKTLKIVLIAVAVIAALAVAYVVLDSIETRAKSDGVPVNYDYGAADRASGNVIYYNGTEYRQKHRTETVLVLGIDKNIESANAVEGGVNSQQCDFIALVIMDNESGTVDILTVNRDTVCGVDMLSLDGKPVGRENMQLALAHTFGTGGADSCENAANAVGDLLGGTAIDHYISFTMDVVPVINDLCGGITLECSDDFGDDSFFRKGSVITLNGADALRYVRARGEIRDDPTNVNRMSRQRQYLDALYRAAVSKAKSDDSFILRAARDTADYLVTDLDLDRLSVYSDRLGKYEMNGIHTLPGTADYSGEYVEFIVDRQQADTLILDLLYDKIEN